MTPTPTGFGTQPHPPPCKGPVLAQGEGRCGAPLPHPGCHRQSRLPGLSSRSALAAAPAAPADASQGTDERPEAGERRQGLLRKRKGGFKSPLWGGGEGGHGAHNDFFFTSPDGLQRTLCFYFCSFEWL